MIDPQLNGKVAIVTGTNNPHGTGAAIALALAGQGVKTCAHFYRANNGVKEPVETGEEFYYAQQNNNADWLIEKLKESGAEGVAIEADLADPAAITAIFDKAAALGPAQILVNNAAYDSPDTFTPHARATTGVGWASGSLSIASIDRHFAVNCRSAALAMAEFAKRHAMRGGTWGRIVNISSDGAPARLPARYPTEPASTPSSRSAVLRPRS